MNRSATRIVVSLLTGLLIIGPVPHRVALAWGDNGHIAVAKVADKYLTATARQKIGELLGGRKIYHRKICMFADTFKHTTAGKFTREWHFVDIPTSAGEYDASRDCQMNNCVVARIVEQKAILENTPATPANKDKRVMALKMLVHLVGDSHQPLHCAERNHDAGGNSLLVKFLDRTGTHNLHSVWDNDILGENMQESDPEEYGDEIQAKITAQQKADWESSDPVKWANEGHKLAIDFAYDGIPMNPPQPFPLDDTYVNNAKPVVESQIQKAGVRLAKLLNQIFQ
jgi:hypothetical protein